MLNEVLERRLLENAQMLKGPHARVRRPLPGGGWGEYSFLSLTERTRIFALHYCEHYLWTFGRSITFDIDPGSETFATLCEMRDSADKWGVAYPLYLEVCFHLLRSGIYAERLAVPNLYFSKRENSKTWRKLFYRLQEERRYSEGVRLTRMPQFWLENDRDLPAQTRVREWLVSLAKDTRRYQDFAETFSVSHRILRPAVALGVVTDLEDRANIVASLRANVKGGRLAISTAPKLEKGDLLQTCFGLPPLETGSNVSSCSNCVHHTACSRAAAFLRSSI